MLNTTFLETRLSGFLYSPLYRKGEDNAKDEAKEFTYLQHAAFRPFHFSGKRTNMMQWKTAKGVIFFIMPLVLEVISVRYQQLKENKNLKAIIVLKATVQAPKHSQETRGTGKMPNPRRAAQCALRLSSEKARLHWNFTGMPVQKETTA